MFVGPGFRRDDSNLDQSAVAAPCLYRFNVPMAGYLYILASRRNGTLYICCNTDLPKRIYEHRAGLIPGFTRRYGVKRLVYLETYDDISVAILRERRMKEWQRSWKIQLLEKDNPFWDDLAVGLLGFDPL